MAPVSLASLPAPPVILDRAGLGAVSYPTLSAHGPAHVSPWQWMQLHTYFLSKPRRIHLGAPYCRALKNKPAWNERGSFERASCLCPHFTSEDRMFYVVSFFLLLSWFFCLIFPLRGCRRPRPSRHRRKTSTLLGYVTLSKLFITTSLRVSASVNEKHQTSHKWILYKLNKLTLGLQST